MARLDKKKINPEGHGLFLQLLDNFIDSQTDKLPEQDWSTVLLFGRIGAVGQLYETIMAGQLKEFELSLVEMTILGLLFAEQVSTPAQLADLTRQTRAGITRTLNRLEKRELVQRKTFAGDGRKVSLHLTPSGKSLYQQAASKVNDWEHQALTGTAEDELADLHQALDLILDKLRRSI